MISPNIDEGYQLLHEGVIALSQIEGNGMRVDLDYLDGAIANTEERIKKLRTKVREHELGKHWQKMFGLKTNFNSREQLAEMLFKPKKFGGLGYIPKDETESGERFKADAGALEHIGIPFVKGYLKLQKLIKANGTYLQGIRREVDSKGFIHPFFNLHTTLTYRSSSDTPNFQNMPIRDPEMGELIRRCFIARKGHVIVEMDFKGIEVGVAACYHLDPVMIKYIKDESMDMHRDMAMQIYHLTKTDWKKIGEHKKGKTAKAIRHAAKNQFVFPEFYGDWWGSCAPNLWAEIEKRGFVGPDGKSLYEHLKAHGITRLGELNYDEDGKLIVPEKDTFFAHVRDVENDFWNKRFMVYGKWKKTWHKKYTERGYFDTFTGFRIGGSLAKNAVINYPVQGSAFHCLLWSLIRIQRELVAKGMKTKIVGQIHDSIVADVAIDELDDYLAIVKRVTSVDLPKAYKWIIVPLVVECEIAPEGTTWFDKQEVKMCADGDYENKDKTYKGSAKGLINFWNEEKQAA